MAPKRDFQFMPFSYFCPEGFLQHQASADFVEIQLKVVGAKKKPTFNKTVIVKEWQAEVEKYGLEEETGLMGIPAPFAGDGTTLLLPTRGEQKGVKNTLCLGATLQ